MIFIERLTKNISSIIYNNSNITNDEKEIIEYGIVILSLKILGILSIIIFGSLFKVLLQSIVFYFTTSELRKFSGGVHSSSPNRCIFIGTFISIITSLCINKIYTVLPIYIIFLLDIFILIFCYYIVLKLSPVDSPAKPISSMKLRKELKKKSMLILFFMSLISFILMILYIVAKYNILLQLSQCIFIGVLWQCFTLTNNGHVIMGKVDDILKYIIRG